MVDDDVLSMDGDNGEYFVGENGDVELEKLDNSSPKWTYSAPGVTENYEVETYYDQEC